MTAGEFDTEIIHLPDVGVFTLNIYTTLPTTGERRLSWSHDMHRDEAEHLLNSLLDALGDRG